MRCCPVCYSKVRPTVYGTATTGTSLEIKYKIQCRNCGFGCDKAGSVIVQYDEETMNPIADAEIAKACGVPESTVYSALNK